MADLSIATIGPVIPSLSVVIPAYNEESNLLKLYQELISVINKIGMPWEVILVDDGSNDQTWQKITLLHKNDERVKGIQFSRNFGHQNALLAGLSCSNGQVVICMDADLQHPPELIPKLINEWQNGNKIVNTIRIDSKNLSAFKKVTSKLFYKIYSLLSGVDIESGMADFRLFDRQALISILQFQEQGLFFRGIVKWIGFPTTQISFQCPERFSGKTKYTIKKMFRFALDGITSFSIIPLRLGVAVGIITGLIAFWQMAYAIYAKVFLNVTVPGWATTIAVMSFMFGILFILLGLMGEYIGRILIETRNRPRFIINEQVGFNLNIKDGPQKRDLDLHDSIDTNLMVM